MRGFGRMLAFVMIVLTAAPPVSAQWLDSSRAWEERDAQGRRTGSVQPQRNGYILRDAQGLRTGSGEHVRPGVTVERDAQGRRIGTIEQRPGGYVMRDAQGRRTGTIEQRGGGGYVRRDAPGPAHRKHRTRAGWRLGPAPCAGPAPRDAATALTQFLVLAGACVPGRG